MMGDNPDEEEDLDIVVTDEEEERGSAGDVPAAAVAGNEGEGDQDLVLEMEENEYAGMDKMDGVESGDEMAGLWQDGPDGPDTSAGKGWQEEDGKEKGSQEEEEEEEGEEEEEEDVGGSGGGHEGGDGEEGQELGEGEEEGVSGSQSGGGTPTASTRAKKRRRKGGSILMPKKVSKDKETSVGRLALRDLSMERLDELLPMDLAGLMSSEMQGARGLGARKGKMLKLNHPRVLEFPYGGDLREYVLGQLRAVCGGAHKGRSLFLSERFAGFAALVNSVSVLLDKDGKDQQACEVARALLSDSEVSRGLAFVALQYLLVELPITTRRRSAADDCTRGGIDEFAMYERRLMLTISNLVGLLHNVLSWEASIADETKRKLWANIKGYEVWPALIRRTLELLDTHFEMRVWKHGPSGMVLSRPKHGGGLSGSKRHIGTFFPKLLGFWCMVLLGGHVEEDKVSLCLKLFARDRNLEVCIRHLQQRSQKRDRDTVKAQQLLLFTLSSKKAVHKLAHNSSFAAVREGVLHTALQELTKFKLCSDQVLKLHLEVLVTLTAEEDARNAVLYIENLRGLLLECVSQLMTHYERLSDVNKGFRGDADAEVREGMQGDAGLFLRLYANLARGDARPFAAALLQKFGGTPTREERINTHVRRVMECSLLGSKDEADVKSCGRILRALEKKKELLELLGDLNFDKSSKEMEQDLASLQKEKGMADLSLSFGDNEKGLAMIQNGQSVLVEGEEAQQFKFKQKHIEWLRRIKNADEPVPFVMLARNTYLHRKYKQLKPDDIQVCRCRKWPGRAGCSDDSCLLRQLFVECTPGFCPCGDSCTNQRFQKCQYANTEVRKTDGRGFGLFALSKIRKGDFVIEYMGEILNNKMYQRRKQLYAVEHNTYFMALRTEPMFEMIDASRKSTMARFLNHCCDANCETRKWLSLGEIVVGIFARQDIEPGEELTFDYQMTDGSLGRKCQCGAARCRGLLSTQKLEHLERRAGRRERQAKRQRRIQGGPRQEEGE